MDVGENDVAVRDAADTGGLGEAGCGDGVAKGVDRGVSVQPVEFNVDGAGGGEVQEEEREGETEWEHNVCFFTS